MKRACDDLGAMLDQTGKFCFELIDKVRVQYVPLRTMPAQYRVLLFMLLWLKRRPITHAWISDSVCEFEMRAAVQGDQSNLNRVLIGLRVSGWIKQGITAHPSKKRPSLEQEDGRVIDSWSAKDRNWDEFWKVISQIDSHVGAVHRKMTEEGLTTITRTRGGRSGEPKKTQLAFWKPTSGGLNAVKHMLSQCQMRHELCVECQETLGFKPCLELDK